MVLTNIKNKQKESGFTIVELLVVIVVIGILAAITIVSYTGITAKANTTSARSAATSVRDAAETYFANNSSYPISTAEFNDTTKNSTKLPSGISLGAPDSTSGKTKVKYSYCGATAAPTTGNILGAKIEFWDFTTSQLASANSTPEIFYIGTAAAGLGVGVGTVCNTWVVAS